MAPITVAALTPATFPDLAALFEAPGGPRHCWCRVWRAALPGMNAGTAADRRAIRRDALAAEVRAGLPAGLIAYRAGAPAGWLSCGPKDSFARLGAPPSPPGQVWSLVCFYVPHARRGQGIARALLAAAADAGRAAGCTELESTAVAPGERAYGFLGSTAFYAREGFVPVAPLGTRRTVMRRALA